MAINLSELPNEIIYEILLCLPPTSVPKVQRVSRQFNDLSQPILWRLHCRTQFKFWNSEHEIHEKFSGAVARVEWKKIFIERHRVDHVTTRQIDSILSSQRSRIEKTESIVAHGYDAKDTLLRHLNVGAETEDVLSRRFYSDAVLGNLQRSMAIKEWLRLKDGAFVSLERALVAFDMFVLHGRQGDFNEVSALLDRIAEQVRDKIEDFVERSPRLRAIALCEYLRDNNLVGVSGETRYHDLRNNFAGIALQDENHPSLPLISVTIFCCVATRLGIDAQPCGFPFHVLAIIKPPPGRTLDDGSVQVVENGLPMYMDPFRSSKETNVQHLRSQLQSLGVPSSDHSDFLNASTTEDIVRRSAKNIIASVQALPRQDGAAPMSTAPSFPEMDGALYAALWSLILLPEGGHETAALQRTRYLGFIVERMANRYSMDVGLIEEHVLPLITDPGHRQNLIETIRVIRTGDHTPKEFKPRSPDIATSVQYKVGQVFHHKRYHYQAIITGWDLKCELGPTWMAHMGIHTLPRGEYQSFYHVLVEDRSVRYVAEENIKIIPQDVDSNLMALAGQHFKRWNAKAKVFVSNIKDEYPDD